MAGQTPPLQLIFSSVQKTAAYAVDGTIVPMGLFTS